MVDRLSRLPVIATYRFEAAAWAVCLLVAASLRWHDLGGEPLTAAEATHVWAAWSSAVGSGDVGPVLATPPTSALLFSLNWLLFWMTAGAGGDAVARAWSALAGVLLVPAPLLLRGVLGPAGALSAGALLSVDPVLIRISRVADGASLTALCGLGALAALVGAETAEGGGRACRATLAALCVALLLVSGQHAWAVAAMLAVGGVARAGSRVRQPGRAKRSVRRSGVGLGALVGRAAFAGLLITTTGLAQWEGPAYVSASLGAAAGSWSAIDMGIPLGPRLARVGAEQGMLLVFGAVGVARWMWGRGDGRFAAGGVVGILAVAIALACAPGATDGDRVPLTLLLAVAGGPALAGTLRRVAGVDGWRGRPARVLVVACAALTLVAPLRAALRATNRGVVANATHPAVRLLAEDIATSCLARGGECSVQVVADPWPHTVLAWYLRDLSGLRWVLAPDIGDAGLSPPVAVVVPLAGAPARSVPPGYVGRVYPLQRDDAGGRGASLWVNDHADGRRVPGRGRG